MELCAEKIKSLLDTQAEVFVYDTVSSTNLIAQELAEKFDKPVIVAAESQTEGRGRSGKKFFSPPTGLYFSIVTHPKSDFKSMTTVTCATAVAVTRAVEKLTGLHPEIKWVNDIFIDGRKVCGILCRAVGGNGRVNHLVTGVGINISTKDFPDDIKNTAGSLNRAVDKNIFAAEIANNILSLGDGYMDEYREKSCVIGKKIVYYKNSEPLEAQAVGIDDNGGLIVFDGKEKTTLTGGEISVKLKGGI